MTVNQQIDSLAEFTEPDFVDLLCGIDESLVIRFFHYFSRFEHALKLSDFKIIDSGFIKGANWWEFADESCPEYPTHNPLVDEAVRYICDNPPKRQRENLTWFSRRRIRPYSFSEALKQVPNIRNNLFHGGKYLRPNATRDSELLRSAIFLMQFCLMTNHHFFERFQCTDR
mgnify:CR=1 FL=1